MTDVLVPIVVGWTGLSLAVTVAGAVLMTRYKHLKDISWAPPEHLQAEGERKAA